MMLPICKLYNPCSGSYHVKVFPMNRENLKVRCGIRCGIQHSKFFHICKQGSCFCYRLLNVYIGSFVENMMLKTKSDETKTRHY
jgi:hypothetical protein